MSDAVQQHGYLPFPVRHKEDGSGAGDGTDAVVLKLRKILSIDHKTLHILDAQLVCSLLCGADHTSGYVRDCTLRFVSAAVWQQQYDDSIVATWGLPVT